MLFSGKTRTRLRTGDVITVKYGKKSSVEITRGDTVLRIDESSELHQLEFTDRHDAEILVHLLAEAAGRGMTQENKRGSITATLTKL